MDTVPTVDPNLARAAAFFIVWRTTTPAVQGTIQGIMRRYATRTPAFSEALDQVAHIYRRARQPHNCALPVEARTFVNAKDIGLFLALHHNSPDARALALVTLWRDADGPLRNDIEQLIRGEMQTTPRVRVALAKATSVVEQYTKNEDTFIAL